MYRKLHGSLAQGSPKGVLGTNRTAGRKVEKLCTRRNTVQLDSRRGAMWVCVKSEKSGEKSGTWPKKSREKEGNAVCAWGDIRGGGTKSVYWNKKVVETDFGQG